MDFREEVSCENLEKGLEVHRDMDKAERAKQLIEDCSLQADLRDMVSNISQLQDRMCAQLRIAKEKGLGPTLLALELVPELRNELTTLASYTEDCIHKLNQLTP